MKIGQWARYSTRRIDKEKEKFSTIEKITEIITINKKTYLKFVSFGILYDVSGCVIADTPQELVQRNDLVVLTRSNGKASTPFVVSDNHKENCAIYEDFKSVSHNDITEIWTRTSDNTYTRQWKKDD